MLNLLPFEKKKAIKDEYKGRRLIIILGFVAMTLLILIIFLLPTFLLANIRYEQAGKDNEALKVEVEKQKSKDMNLGAAEAEELALLQRDVVSSSTPTYFLNILIVNKGAGVRLTNFSVQSDENKQEVTVQGVATTREDLIAYRQALERTKIWSKVDLPIGDLGPPKNNKFSMSLLLAPQS